MKSPTILMLVLWFDEVPGTWTYFKEMASQLANAGLKVIIVSPRAKGKKLVEEAENILVFRYSSFCLSGIPLPFINPLSFLSTLKRILQREKRINLIYDTTSGLLPSSLLVKILFKLKGTKIPLVIHVHGELKELKSKGALTSLLSELYLHLVTRFCLAMADKVLLAGERIVPRVLSFGVKPEKVRVVRVGLKYEDKLSRFKPLSLKERAKLRRSIGIKETDFVLGYVGRLSPGKGIDTLLKAVSVTKNLIPELKVLLIGEGQESERLKVLTWMLHIEDIVFFLGYRCDVLDLLQIMDVFVNLTHSEVGISASQIEAMRVGLPSVVTPFTNFLNHMEDAIIVPFADVKAVANAIFQLYKDKKLRKFLGMNAILKAEKLLKLHTWNGYVNGFLQALKDLGVYQISQKACEKHMK